VTNDNIITRKKALALLGPHANELEVVEKMIPVNTCASMVTHEDVTIWVKHTKKTKFEYSISEMK
jgi:hypothetical protein